MKIHIEPHEWDEAIAWLNTPIVRHELKRKGWLVACFSEVTHTVIFGRYEPRQERSEGEDRALRGDYPG